ncbi:MAG TPA: hypothetical protein VGZ93_08770 [Candidatus Methylacidiphilales bacterium]|nr:hypothetical protein [Candidatus Methylacidiphilales bacterium]
MSSKCPITLSLPIGLFGTVTMSVPQSSPAEIPLPSFPINRELLDMPAVGPGTDGLDDDLYWNDESA